MHSRYISYSKITPLFLCLSHVNVSYPLTLWSSGLLLFNYHTQQAIRQSSVLYNNFNITLDILRANNRKLQYVDWKDGAAIVINVIAVIMMLCTLVIAAVLIWKVKETMQISTPAHALKHKHTHLSTRT